MEMSLSDFGLHMSLLQKGRIGSSCVHAEWDSLSGVRRLPPPHLPAAVLGARQDTGLYFILFIRWRPFHLPHTCFPLDVCLFSHMKCSAVEASHLPDIGNSGEGLLKQTQYSKTSQLSLWTMQRMSKKALHWLVLMSYWDGFASHKAQQCDISHCDFNPLILIWCSFHILLSQL